MKNKILLFTWVILFILNLKKKSSLKIQNYNNLGKINIHNLYHYAACLGTLVNREFSDNKWN